MILKVQANIFSLIGPRQIGPRQMGPWKMLLRQIWPWENCDPEFFQGKLLFQRCEKLYSQVLDAQIQKYKYTNTQIQYIIIGSIYPIQIYTLGNICQLNSYICIIGIRCILPTIGGYMSIGGRLCALQAHGCGMLIF